MNAVASLVKKAANSANKFSGDGTTTTTLLTFELLRYTRVDTGLHTRGQALKSTRESFGKVLRKERPWF